MASAATQVRPMTLDEARKWKARLREKRTDAERLKLIKELDARLTELEEAETAEAAG